MDEWWPKSLTPLRVTRPQWDFCISLYPFEVWSYLHNLVISVHSKINVLKRWSYYIKITLEHHGLFDGCKCHFIVRPSSGFQACYCDYRDGWHAAVPQCLGVITATRMRKNLDAAVLSDAICAQIELLRTPASTSADKFSICMPTSLTVDNVLHT